jgi:guanine nucleotide-binding protein subunit alpha
MRVVLEAAASLKIELHSPEALEAAQILLALPPHGTPWSPEIAGSVKMLWSDKGIKDTFNLGNKKYQLNETAGYFFDEIDRFVPETYVPSIDDVLRVRVRSTGIEEATFTFDDINFLVVDVGGQRS